MKHHLQKALEADDAREKRSERILEAAFFRKAPLQAGTQPTGGGRVLHLDERRREAAASRG